MVEVKRDELGIYIKTGGAIVRPSPSFPTCYTFGDSVSSHHFGGTVFYGVGKDSSCKRGSYVEKWVGCGLSSDSPDELKSSYKWYMSRFEDLSYEKDIKINYKDYIDFDQYNPMYGMKPLIIGEWMIEYNCCGFSPSNWRVFHQWKKLKHFDTLYSALSYYKLGYFKDGIFHSTLKSGTLKCPKHGSPLDISLSSCSIYPDPPMKSFNVYLSSCSLCSCSYEINI